MSWLLVLLSGSIQLKALVSFSLMMAAQTFLCTSAL
jgi:hypothetical protein